MNGLKTARTIYRLNLKSAGENPFEFCKKKDIIGIGWLLNNPDKTNYFPESIEDCKRKGIEIYGKSGFIKAINRIEEMEIDDLIWTRDRLTGIYYLCRVVGGWKYEASPEHIKADVIHTIPVEWIKVGTIDETPGKIVNSFRAPSTLQRVSSDVTLQESMKIYNEKMNLNYYKVETYKNSEIFDLLQAEDVEEIVSLYLQLEKDYLLYSSTNQLDTIAYEFVLINKTGDHRAFAQVKTGRVPLLIENYHDFIKAMPNTTMYLFAVSEHYGDYHHDNICPIYKEELLEFMITNREILPERVKRYLRI